MTCLLAWRNLWRHRARTLITGSAVAFLYALTLLGLGINDDAHRRMLEEATAAAGGDVLIHGLGFWETRASDRVIRDADARLEIVGGVAGVHRAIPRIHIDGLLSTSAGSAAALLTGLRPELEVDVTDPAADLTRGTFLADGGQGPLVLGSRLVELLELELGERVVLTASDPEGELVRALFHLSGIVETGIRGLDETAAYTTIEAARAAVGMEGMLSQIGVLGEPGAEPDRLAPTIEASLEGRGAGGLEILTWQEAVPEMVGFVELDDAFGFLFMLVLLVVVLFSITNTFLMAVMERVRELGLLGALGVGPYRIGRLLLMETLLLTGLAMGVGFILGYGGHLAVARWGISVASYGIEEIEISGIDLADLVFHSSIVPARWIAASLLVAGSTVASAFYPAWRASRLVPAEAMRFYE